MNYASYKIGGVGWIVCNTDVVIATGTDESEILDQLEGYLGTPVARLEQSPPEEFFATFQIACASQLQALEAADQFAMDEYNEQATKIAIQTEEITALRSAGERQQAVLDRVQRGIECDKRRIVLTDALDRAGGFKKNDINTIVINQLHKEGYYE